MSISPIHNSNPMRQLVFLTTFAVLSAIMGCQRPFMKNSNTTVSQVLSPNPASVVIPNHEFAWNQIVDEVDNYFKIKKEERVRLDEGIISEGVITTYPTPGSTLLEPWRKDSSPGFEKWQSTFQTIRRTATVRVIPNGTTYLIDVQVEKELEDLPKPENAVAGSLRTNVSTQIDEDGLPFNRRRQRWFPIGRDTPLEQRILAAIQGRLAVNGI